MKKLFTIAILAAMLITSAWAADAQVQAMADKGVAHEIAELMRSKGYPDDNPIIQAASSWWWQCDLIAPAAETVSEDGVAETDAGLSYTTPEQWAEHPAAAACYEYLRGTMGLPPAVSAGIIGSWMEECGGQTLDLQWWIYGGSGKYTYYGLAMWSMIYCSEISGADLTTQLDYFARTLETNIQYFGGDYAYFTSLTDPQTVVQYYYQYYGRGYGSASRQRCINGSTALAYFGGA